MTWHVSLPWITAKQSIAEKSNYFPFIDGLRGIAILMVLLVHTSTIVGNDHIGSFTIPKLEGFINAGAQGVQLFFMLSAFTLFNSSQARYRTDRYPIIAYYIRRAFRILPFWCLMVIYFAFVNGVLTDIPRIVTNISFVFGFVRFKEGVELIPGGWSLFSEETFYLLLPLIFVFVRDIYQAFKFFMITFCLSYVWLLLAPRFGVPDGNAFVFLFPLSQWFAFPMGIVVYFLTNNEEVRTWVFDNPKCFLVLDSIAFIAMFLLLTGGFYVATFSLFFLFVASVPEKTLFGTLTRNPLLMRFGAYCYSIYLFQFAVLYALDPVKDAVFSKLGIAESIVEVKLFVWFPIVALISLFLAFFTFNMIEKPCVSVGKKLIPEVNQIIDSSRKYVGKVVRGEL